MGSKQKISYTSSDWYADWYTDVYQFRGVIILMVSDLPHY